MLSCKEITELVTEYLERRLPLGQHLKFWVHISMCGHCRRYLRQMRMTVRLASHQPVAPPSPEVRDALKKAFRNWKKP